MEKAILKAIEGGYKEGCEPVFNVIDNTPGINWSIHNRPTLSERLWSSDILLDPLFWQALGKAEGWGDKKIKIHCTSSMKDVGSVGETFERFVWENMWHHLIDHLAKGGDAESFFNELLK